MISEQIRLLRVGRARDHGLEIACANKDKSFTILRYTILLSFLMQILSVVVLHAKGLVTKVIKGKLILEMIWYGYS